MAKTNVKKKKKSSYDEKLITIIAASVGALIAAIVVAVIVVSYFSSYVAKVDGERIYKYEYQSYLSKAMSDIKQEAIDDGKLDEDADSDAIAAFWTDAKKQEAADRAMKEVSQWKAEYILAKKAGFKLSYKERNTYKENINYQMQYNYQQYSSYYSYDQFVKMYLGMPMDEYLEMAVQDAAISQYKDELKKAYTTTDAELKGIYDEKPDDYRLITLRVFGLTLPDEIEAVEKPVTTGDDGKELTKDDMTETEWNELQAQVTAYKEYETKVKERNAEIDEIKDRLAGMAKQLNETGKYTENVENSKEEDSDADASDTASTDETDSYKDATLADIIKEEGAMFTDTAGVKEINAVTSSGYDTLDEYAITMQWADEACTKIQSEQKDKDGKDIVADADGEKVGEITYTKYVVLEDDDYIYVVRCEGIEDFANSEESSEGAEDSVKDTIKKELYEDKAVAELEKKVADAGDKYKVEKKRQASIDKINKEQVWG